MPIISDITQGTISVAANGTAVTGVGTAFQTAGFQEGDLLFAAGYTGVVLSVTSNTALTLAQPWKGGALSGSAYRLRYQGDASRLTAMARQLITMLGTGGNIEALATLVGAANKFPVFSGAGTMDARTITDLALSLIDDPDAATFYNTLGIIPNASLPARIRQNPTGLSAAGALNAITETGWYSMSSANVVTVGGPAGASAGIVLHLEYGNAGVNAAQFFIGVNRNQQFTRFKNASAWSPWVLSGLEIVGTVSQASDGPRGAIIERGSNANGEYTRWADGTQICWYRSATTVVTNTAQGSLFRAVPSGTFLFPVAFVGSEPEVIGSGEFVSGTQGWSAALTTNLTSVNLRIWSSGNDSTWYPGYVAIGRWF